MKKSKIIFLFKKYLRNPKRLILGIYNNGKNYVFGRNRFKAPVCVVWNLTQQCNLLCSFCGYSKSQNNILELTLEQQFKIIDKLSENGVWLVSFCGGEPLLVKNLDKLIQYAKKSKLLVNISTNGLLLKEKAKMLVDSGVDYLTISIDSYRPETLQKLRNDKNLLNNILEGIELIRQYSKRQIYIEARCLINKINMYELKDYVSFWKSKVNNIVFKPIYNNRSINYSVPDNFNISLDEKEIFTSFFNNIMNSYVFLDNKYHRGIPDFLFAPDKLKQQYFCFAGIFFASVDYLGNLYSCSEFSLFKNEPLGNLLNDNFENIWNNEKSIKIRETICQNRHCNCWMDRFDLNIWLYKFFGPIKSLIRK